MKTLCVYHTRSGNSERIARMIAENLGAEVLSVTDGKEYQGFFGYLAAAVRGLKKDLPALPAAAPEHPLEEYERVIAVAPVWCENVSPVMRSFLSENKGKLTGEVYYVIGSMSGMSYRKKIDALQDLTGRSYTDLLEVKTHGHDYSGEVAAFAKKLKGSL